MSAIMSRPISGVTRAVLVLTTQYTIKLQPPLRLSSIIQIVCFYCLQLWVEIELNCPSVDWGWPCVSEACLPQIRDSVETNLFFERIRISNLIRNPEIFRIRIRTLFIVIKFSNPNPNIRDSGEKIRIRIRI